MKNGKYSETKNIFSFNKYAAGSTFHYQTELCWVSDMTGHRASGMVICCTVSNLSIKYAVFSKCFSVPAIKSHKHVSYLIIFLVPFYRNILKHCCMLTMWCIKLIHIVSIKILSHFHYVVHILSPNSWTVYSHKLYKSRCYKLLSQPYGTI